MLAVSDFSVCIINVSIDLGSLSLEVCDLVLEFLYLYRELTSLLENLVDS